MAYFLVPHDNSFTTVYIFKDVFVRKTNSGSITGYPQVVKKFGWKEFMPLYYNRTAFMLTRLDHLITHSPGENVFRDLRCKMCVLACAQLTLSKSAYRRITLYGNAPLDWNLDSQKRMALIWLFVIRGSHVMRARLGAMMLNVKSEMMRDDIQGFGNAISSFLGWSVNTLSCDALAMSRTYTEQS